MGAEVSVSTSGADGLPVSEHAQRHATSARALDRHGLGKRVDKCGRLLAILRDAHAAGVRDMTGAELVAHYEARHGERIETGRVAARLSELADRKLVERLPDERVCTVTGYMARPVRAVPQQGRLV